MIMCFFNCLLDVNVSSQSLALQRKFWSFDDLFREFATTVILLSSSVDVLASERSLCTVDSFAWDFLCCSKVAFMENFIPPHRSHV